MASMATNSSHGSNTQLTVESIFGNESNQDRRPILHQSRRWTSRNTAWLFLALAFVLQMDLT